MKLRRVKHRINEAIRAACKLDHPPSTRERRHRYLDTYFRMVEAADRFNRAPRVGYRRMTASTFRILQAIAGGCIRQEEKARHRP